MAEATGSHAAGAARTCVCAAVAALLSGCATQTPRFATVVSSTPVHEVGPANGVWDAEYGKTRDPANLSYSFRLIRYADGIGVRAKVRDDVIVADDCREGCVTCPSWDDDNVQCFFDGDNDGARDSRAGGGAFYGGEYTLVANGAANSDFSSCPRGFGDKWTGTAVRSQRPDGGWDVEYDLRFSWECLGLVRAPRDDEPVAFGFNICVHDDDDGGRADRALYWKGNPEMPYRDESGFGAVVLNGSGKKKNGRKTK